MKNQKEKRIISRIVKLPVSRFINSRYRDYAIYVLENRGIPNFYDALTPVQRFILKNTPTSFVKTLTVIGSVIKDQYHHGDESIIKSLNKLARPFGNATQIIEGYGFFGSEVSPSPAAARYTSVKLSSTANGILGKYSYLTTRNVDGPYDPFWLDLPLGLLIPIVGIAVGYKSTMLPRKLKDIQDFLDGKRKSVKPYFDGFNGTVEKYKGVDKAWIISSTVNVEDKRIMIREIPPILKYTVALKKLDHLFTKYEGNIRIEDNSKDKVNVDIIYTGRSTNELDDIVNFVKKTFSIIVTENPIFIKDEQVLIYDSVEQYLEDYKWQIARLKLKNTEYERNKLDFDLKFNYAKELFIKFILDKKRTNDEIDIWLKPYDKEISERLERMTSRKFTLDELTLTKEEIKRLIKELKEKEKELKGAQKAFDKYPDPTIARGISSKHVSINLFETSDFDSIDNIDVWDGEDVYDEEKGENEEKIDE